MNDPQSAQAGVSEKLGMPVQGNHYLASIRLWGVILLLAGIVLAIIGWNVAAASNNGVGIFWLGVLAGIVGIVLVLAYVIIRAARSTGSEDRV